MNEFEDTSNFDPKLNNEISFKILKMTLLSLTNVRNVDYNK